MILSNFADLQDGLAAIYLADFNSEFYKCQQVFSSKTESSPTLQTLWHNLQTPLSEEWNNFLQKINDLKNKKSFDEAIIWVKIEGGQPIYLAHKLKPETKYNWLEVANQFEINYNNEKADDENLWAWGQLIQETGEYLCRDCGYIESFEAGNVFPVCEVCLAGDPEGPLEVVAGFWEKI